MAKSDAKAQDKKDKGKTGKGKKGKGGKDKGSGGPSLATHPLAAHSVNRAKGIGGLAGFALAAWLAHRAGLTPAHVLERALIAGVVGMLLARACAVVVWRHLLLAQLRTAGEQLSMRPALVPRPTIPLVAATESEAGPSEGASGAG